MSSIVFNSAVTNLSSLIVGSGGGGGGGTTVNSTNDFRLTLASGFPVYNPQQATPSSTDTTNMTVTFTNDPLWATGTIVTIQGTVGGLTQGTRYYIRQRSANLYSFHTSLAGAQGDTGKVTLTASITNPIVPSGITNTTLYLSPFKGNSIALFDGVSTWTIVTSAEVSLPLGTLTSGKNYDVFCYNNSNVPTLEFLAWTSDTVRATALVRQDGVWVKTGATTRRYVGTFRTDTTTTTIMETGVFSTSVSAKLYVFNADNGVIVPFMRLEQTTTWTYGTAAWRQANGSTTNQIEVVCGLDGRAIELALEVDVSCSQGSAAQVCLGEDSTTVPSFYASVGLYFINTLNGANIMITAFMQKLLPVGFHTYAWIEYGGTGISFNSAFNLDRRRGISGKAVL